MRRIAVIGVAVATMQGATSRGWAESMPQVKAIGVQVASPGYGEGRVKGSAELRAFGFAEGTSAAVLVVFEDGGIVKFDSQASKLTKFQGDQGTDLTDRSKERRVFRATGFGFSAPVSKDGKACVVQVNGPRAPAKNCKALTVEGELVFLRAEGQTTVKQDAELKVGAQIQAADLAMKITKVEKPRYGGALAVTFQVNKPLDVIADVKFLDAGGNEIKTAGIGRMSFMGQNSLSCTLKQKVEKATVVVSLWQNLKQAKVSLALKIGLGL